MAKKGKKITDVIRGDARQVSCTFYESDGTTKINLTGGTVYFTVQTSNNPSNDSSVVIQKSASSGFTDATNGNHIFTLSHSDTDVTPATYYYDIQLVDGDGGYLSSYKGEFIVVSDITRS